MSIDGDYPFCHDLLKLVSWLIMSGLLLISIAPIQIIQISIYRLVRAYLEMYKLVQQNFLKSLRKCYYHLMSYMHHRNNSFLLIVSAIPLRLLNSQKCLSLYYFYNKNIDTCVANNNAGKDQYVKSRVKPVNT